ncbi:MAG: hypothetical protein R3C19_26160 [Planctomycetaceae bacterium]
MPRLLLPNFTFEDQLTGRSSRETPETKRAADELAPLMALLAEPGDTVIVRDSAIPAGLPDCLNHAQFRPLSADMNGARLVPWGWSSVAAELAVSLGADKSEWPPIDVVRDVNSRRFSARFDDVAGSSDAGVPALDGGFGTLCSDRDEWRRAVSALAASGYDRWVAKPDISHAGRNRLIAVGLELNAQQRGWLDKHLQLPGGVYVEPWVRTKAECGLQFEIGRDDSIDFLGATELLNDPVGRYQGSIIRAAGEVDSRWMAAVEHGHRICREAQHAGYFGPLGIDCMMYETADGDSRLRLANDVNGRFTMGRLALQLRTLLKSGEVAAWWHNSGSSPVQSEGSPEFSLSPCVAKNVRTVRTYPQSIGCRPVRATSILYVCSGPEVLPSLLELLRPGPTN